MADLADAVAGAKQLEAERRTWRLERRELEGELEQLHALLDVTRKAGEKRGRQIDWTARRTRTATKRAVATFILSDLHLDEVVRAEEMHGVNAYDRRIAELRMRRWTEKACSLPGEYLSGVDYDGAALFIGGDLISGDIHAELRRTNADTVAGTIAHWIDPLSAAVGALADTYGKVTVDVVAGNHGRNPMERRDPAKFRARDNFDTLIGWLIARDFRDDQRVTFNVSESIDTTRAIYSTRYLLYHGQAKGGSGIAGALSPLMLLSHRKGKAKAAVGQGYDLMVIGHWHQYMSLPGQGLIVNGSLKGYDEYASASSFAFEPPQQAMWLTTPEHGVTVQMPIKVSDRKTEKW